MNISDDYWLGRSGWARAVRERTAIVPRLVTAPTVEPVTTAEAKNQLRVDTNNDDTYIDTLIKSARIGIEAKLNRSLITTSWSVTLDAFPLGSDPIIMPRPPLIAVTSIVYTDTGQTQRTLASTEYTVDAQSEPGRVMPAYTKIWPIALPHINAVTVTYTAGYGATATSVPQTIKQAILLWVTTLYEQRTPVVIGQTVLQVPDVVENLIANDRWTPL